MTVQIVGTSTGYSIFEGTSSTTLGFTRGTILSSYGSPVILAPARLPTVYLATNQNMSVGTSSASGRLTVWGKDILASSLPFIVANSASTTVFSVSNTGTASTTNLQSQVQQVRQAVLPSQLPDSYQTPESRVVPEAVEDLHSDSRSS